MLENENSQYFSKSVNHNIPQYYYPYPLSNSSTNASNIQNNSVYNSSITFYIDFSTGQKYIFNDNNDGHTPENYLKMFKHIKENQIFYNTYFTLNYDNYPVSSSYYDIEFAKKWNRDKLIEYHAEFFKAGITAIIKKWLSNGCKESPEDITEVLVSEYIKQ